MTVENSSSLVTLTGNGVTTSWPYTFIIPDDASARVGLFTIASNTLVEINAANYTITGINNPAGGSVAYPLVGDPISSDYRLVIWREVEYQQQLELTDQAPYYAKTLERGLDRIVMQIQQLAEDVGRSLQVPRGSTEDAIDIVARVEASAVAAAASASASASSASSAAAAAAQAAAAALVAGVDHWVFTKAAATAALGTYANGDVVGVFADETRGGGLALYLVVAGVLVLGKLFVRSEVHPEDFGAVGDGVTDDTVAIIAALSTGIKVVGKPGAIYRLASAGTIANAPKIDFDQNGSGLVNDTAGTRTLIIDYPYGAAVAITALNLAAKQFTVTSAAPYALGQRMKIISSDRCPGMRDAPGDGSNYWQSQTFTIADITGNVMTMAEAVEADFTFATTPKIMPMNTNSFKMYGGYYKSTPGFEGVRHNGLLRVRGGTDHDVSISVPNANDTAIEFYGCDGVKFHDGRIKSVGTEADTSGAHGVSFQACINPVFTRNKAHDCRHATSTNDTPTQWADANYYVMGPCYNIDFGGNQVTGDRGGGLSTHHGVRGGSIHDNIITDSVYGVAVRGRNISILNNLIDRCGSGVFVYSEDTLANIDKTDGTFVAGNKTTHITDQDLQIQKTLKTTLGDNFWNGNAPRGAFINTNDTLALTGDQSFASNATFAAGGKYFQVVSTDIEGLGRLALSIAGMTPNGTNQAIYCSGTEAFYPTGDIVVDAPAIALIFQNVSSGDATLPDILYSGGPAGNPISGEVSQKTAKKDASYNSAYQTKTASAAYALTLLNSRDPQVSVTLLTLNGSFSLASVTDGKFRGQRLLIRQIDTVGSNTFTLPALANFDIRGASIVMPDGDIRAFVWSGSAWVIESRA